MRATPFAALALLLLLVGSGIAAAHGYQNGGLPEPSSISETAPARVVVLMSEPIEPAFSRVRVFDVDGGDQATGKAYAPEGNLSRLAVDVGALVNGTYTVAWEARWTSDGHDTKGTYGFAIGNVSIADLLAAETTTEFEGPSPAEVALRTFSFVGAFLAAGAFLFCYFVDHGRSGPKGERIVLLAGIAGGAILAVATVATWMHHAASVYGTGLMAAPMMALAENTYIGKVFATRLAIAVALVAASTFALRVERPAAWTLAAILAVLALPTFTLTSHAASESSHRALSIVADIVHLIGAAAWVGGLPLLAYALWRMRRDTNPEAGHIARRFSRLAMISSALVVVTGGVAAFLLVGPGGNPLASAYGRVLVAKLALVVVILLLGAWNQFVQIPRLEKRADARTGLVRSATLETVLAVFVLVAAGTLTGLAPGGPAEAAPTLATFDGDGVEMHAHMEITPNRVGINEFNLTLTKLANGANLANTRKVELFIEPPRSDDESLGMATVTLTPHGDGTYSGRATLGLPGTWTVTVFVQRPDAYDDAVVFSVDV